MEILDCTLRDGSHALAEPFRPMPRQRSSKDFCRQAPKSNRNSETSGIGSTKGNVSDEAYLEAVSPFTGEGELGMFCNPRFFGEHEFEIACRYNIGFLRVGCVATSVEPSEVVIAKVRKAGIKVRFSLIQAHSLHPKTPENARKVTDYGAQSVTIMDSTGTMVPSQVREYVEALVRVLMFRWAFTGTTTWPVRCKCAGSYRIGGFIHRRSDCRSCRSAGNAPTEILCAVLDKTGLHWDRLISASAFHR